MSREQSDRLLDYLVSCEITAKTFEHPPVHTVEESQRLRGDIAGLHTKNMFLRDGKKNYFLFVTDENAKIELKKLAKKIGARGGLSFASAEALMEHLAIEPGSVSLLAAFNDTAKAVTIVLDDALQSAEFINCHPLVNTRTTSLTRSDLDKFLAATAHVPVYVSMNDSAPE